MSDDSIGVIGKLFARWSDLDTGWQAVLVGVAIAALVVLFDPAIPW